MKPTDPTNPVAPAADSVVAGDTMGTPAPVGPATADPTLEPDPGLPPAPAGVSEVPTAEPAQVVPGVEEPAPAGPVMPADTTKTGV